MKTSSEVKRKSLEEKIDAWFVTPIFRQLWTVLMGIGVILQKNVPIAATLITPFLLPVHFTIEGLEKFWDSYRLLRQKNAAQRKMRLGINALQIAALVAASCLVALAVTNPVALPILFVVLNVSTIIKNSYVYHQTQKKRNALRLALKDLLKTGQDTQEIERIRSEIDALNDKKDTVQRQLFFNGAAIFGVSLIFTGAVLSLVFPPAAGLVSFVGFMVFAGSVITAVLTNLALDKKGRVTPPAGGAMQDFNDPDLAASQTMVAEEKEIGIHTKAYISIEKPIKTPLAEHQGRASSSSPRFFPEQAAFSTGRDSILSTDDRAFTF